MISCKNPILNGFYPDPSICRVGEWFYLVNSTFAYYPGIPIFRSRNLAQWEQIGNVLTRESQVPLRGSGHNEGIYAPTIRWHEGTFYIITTNVAGGGNFIVTAKDPAGPWSEPYFLEEAEGIDPSLFFDDDGSCYYIGQRQNSDGSRYFGDCEIWIRKLNPETFELEGEAHPVLYGFQKNAVWPEGPHLYKRNGYYYILHAESGTEQYHCEVAARSRNIFGPYEYARTNPILTHRHLGSRAEITCVGHCDLTEDQAGNWYMVVLGCRPQDGKTFRGRETFLAKVEWEDDWPVVNPGIGMIQKEVELPGEKDTLMPESLSESREYLFKDLQEKQLPPEFLMLRNPDTDAYVLDNECLMLPAKAVTLKDKATPSYVALRQTSAQFLAETEFTLKGQPKDRAGIAYIQNDQNYLCVEYEEDESYGRVYVTACIGGENKILVERKTEIRLCQNLRLIVNKNCAEAWLKKGDIWECVLENIDISYMCSESAGGFTGCTGGMYTHSGEKQSSGYTKFYRFVLTTVARIPSPL